MDKSHCHPYYIATAPFYDGSAGVRATYALCDELIKQGYEAYASYPNDGRYNAPVLTPEIENRHRDEGKIPIAVYSEHIHGNSYNSPVVVRWILGVWYNFWDYVGSPNPVINFFFRGVRKVFGIKHRLLGYTRAVDTYGVDDLTYVYSKIYNYNNGDYPELYVDMLERNLFFEVKSDTPREGFCWYASKYLAFGGKVDEYFIKHGINLSRDAGVVKKDLPEIFRRCKVMYSFEETSTSADALMCGCPVVLVGTNYWAERNISLKPDESTIVIPEQDIISRNNHDYDLAKQPRLCIDGLNKMMEYGKKTVADFAAKTQMAVEYYIAHKSMKGFSG